MIIAWLVSAYNKLDVLVHIVNKIIKESNNKDIILIHYDKKSPIDDLKYLRTYYKNNSQVRIYSEIEVVWAGRSSIYVDRFLANQLLNSKQHFDYVINSTGTTYFGNSYSNLQKFLKEQYSKSFIMLDPDEIINLKDSSEYARNFHYGHFSYKNRMGGGRIHQISY